MLADQAEGYRLFLSTNVSTKSQPTSDVVERADGKYDALDYELCSLGTFETALEAAVAVAKYKAGSRPRAANVDPDVVEGYTLLRSSSTASGYAGVYQLPTGKFKASACFDGKSTHIGHGHGDRGGGRVRKARRTERGGGRMGRRLSALPLDEHTDSWASASCQMADSRCDEGSMVGM